MVDPKKIETVTRRFYEDYAAVFKQVEKLTGRHGRPHAPRAEDGTRRVPVALQGDDLRRFTQTLFNRLMFVRFMEGKGWLTFAGRKDYLRALYAAHCSPHAPCAEDGTRRVPATNEESFYKGRLCPLFFEGLAVEGKQQSEAYGQVPYLDGGLFERSELDRQVTDLPDEAFAGILADEHAGGLFYRYEFTVEESAPLDGEVAVDPEMLGKVFEELVTGRHESGAYYTPRPVVSFMCREALKGYLVDKLDVVGARRVPSETDPARSTCRLQSAVTAFVDRHDASNLNPTQARAILAALDDLKAVDPACGSGAYLLGLLQEMIALYRLLYSEKLVRDARTPYDLKLRIISRSLYGMDIDPFATNIAKLRLWLSLAVEADKPAPLPNLDCKIETGDSLLGPDPQEFQRWQQERGFDIVLANPPYVRQELLTDLKTGLERVYPEVYAGAADLYVYFYCRAIQLLRSGGHLVFIAPNKFFRAGYGRKLREYLASVSRLRVLIDFADYPIFQAATYPSIIVAQKCPPVRNREAETLVAYNWKPADDLAAIGPTLAASGTVLSQGNLSGDGWRILDRRTARVLDKLRGAGKQLSAVAGRLCRGIVTGCNEVFEIDEDTRRDLVAQDARSAEIIRPWLRGRNVRRWSVRWGGRFLVFTRRGIPIERYPAVKKYLAQRRDRLEPRPRNVAASAWAGANRGLTRGMKCRTPSTTGRSSTSRRSSIK